MSHYLAKLSIAQAPLKDALSPLGLQICQHILLALWERYGYRNPRPMPIDAQEGGGATLRFEGVSGRSFIIILQRDGAPVYCVHEDAEGRQTSDRLAAVNVAVIVQVARECFEGDAQARGAK